jgi:hypothetical protein
LSTFNGNAVLGGHNLLNAGDIGIGTSSPAYPLDVETGTINTNLNYAVGGSYGTLNYCLASGGSSTAQDKWLPCLTSVTMYYQTIDNGGSALAQQPILNFDGTTIVASPATGQTNVGLHTAGTAGTYVYPSSLTTDTYGRVIAVTAGAGFTSGSNTNGYWEKDPTGLIRQWGYAGVSNTTISFPMAFTNLSSVEVLASNNHVNSGSPIAVSSVGLSSFYASNSGGSDALDWFAIGY